MADESERTATAEAPRGAGKGAAAEGGRMAVVVVVALLVGAISGGTMGALMYNAPAADEQPEPGQDVSFELKAFITGYEGVGGAIDGVINPTLAVNKGDRVTIKLTNGEALGHDLKVDGFAAQTDLVTAVGEVDTIVFTASTEGTFPYYCTVPGHREAGMVGAFVVGSGIGGPGEEQPGPAQTPDVANIARDASDVPPPLNRNTTATVHLWMETREVVAEVEPGTTNTYWTFNGTVPGPFFRVRVGDKMVVHSKNSPDSSLTHSVDFHAVTGPGGGAKATQTAPGEETSFTFKALNPGIFVYHCASPHIPTHVAMGMYGLILVEPEGGLPPVDKEFYVMQGELYTKWPAGTAGHQEFDGEKLKNEEPEYVVFNGRWQALTGPNALLADVNETVRIYFGVGGTNLISSFHVIGEIFDYVYPEGDLVSPPHESIQTTVVAPGGAAAVEFKVDVPGDYILVDHALSRTIDKGCLGILTVSGPENPDVFKPDG